MILSYETFLDLLTALDEYTNCKYARKTLIKIIFRHYIYKGFLVACNAVHLKACFWSAKQESSFLNFMNQTKCKKYAEKINTERKDI